MSEPKMATQKALRWCPECNGYRPPSEDVCGTCGKGTQPKRNPHRKPLVSRLRIELVVDMLRMPDELTRALRTIGEYGGEIEDEGGVRR